jgi:hypothetical protein
MQVIHIQIFDLKSGICLESWRESGIPISLQVIDCAIDIICDE